MALCIEQDIQDVITSLIIHSDRQGRLAATKDMAAIKVVMLKEDELREILLEVEILSDCQHDNIVKYMGTFLYHENLWVSL